MIRTIGFSVGTVLLVASTSFCQPPAPVPPPAPPAKKLLEVPANLKAEPGKMFDITPKTDAAQIEWTVLPEKFDSKEYVRRIDNGKTLTVALPPGTYTLFASVAVENKVAQAVSFLVVDGKPDDVQPNPPVPNPPVGEFEKAMKEAFDKEPVANRADYALRLAALFKLAVKECDNPEHVVGSDLIGVINEAFKNLVKERKALEGVRLVVADELAKVMDESAKLTPANRKALASVYTRAVAALEAMAKQ